MVSAIIKKNVVREAKEKFGIMEKEKRVEMSTTKTRASCKESGIILHGSTAAMKAESLTAL